MQSSSQGCCGGGGGGGGLPPPPPLDDDGIHVQPLYLWVVHLPNCCPGVVVPWQPENEHGPSGPQKPGVFGSA